MIPIRSHTIFVAMFACVVLLATLERQNSALNLIFLPTCLLIGIVAYARSPTRDFVSFIVALWFYAPFVRRLVDWQAGRSEMSLIIITPFVVTLLAWLSLRFGRSYGAHRHVMPFAIILLICTYGLGAGLILGNGTAALYGFLGWVAPIGFALHIHAHRAQAAELRHAFTRAIILHGTIVAAYGIYQFATAPPWDIAWMRAVEMRSLGFPLPFVMRIFSTVNSPGFFALILMVAALLLLDRKPQSAILFGTILIIALALSLVRSAWGGAAIGALAIMLLAGLRYKARILTISLVLTAITLPLLLANYDLIQHRIDTLNDLSADVSLIARLAFAQSMLDLVPHAIFGHGLGASGLAANLSGGGEMTILVFDNGLLDLLFTFGLVGAVIMLLMIFWCLQMLLAITQSPAATTLAAAALAMLVQMVFFNVLHSQAGFLVMSLIALVQVSAATTKSRKPFMPPTKASASQTA